VLDSYGAAGRHYTLVGVASEGEWGKASTALVELMGQDRLIGIISPGPSANRISGIVATARLAAVRFEEYRRCHLSFQASLSDRVHCLGIQANGVRVLLPANVRGNGPFELVLPQLFKERGSEHRVVSGAVPSPMSGSLWQRIAPALTECTADRILVLLGQAFFRTEPSLC